MADDKADNGNTLSQADWRWLMDAAQQRFDRAKPKKGEPPPSKAFLEQQHRIMLFLTRKAY